MMTFHSTLIQSFEKVECRERGPHRSREQVRILKEVGTFKEALISFVRNRTGDLRITHHPVRMWVWDSVTGHYNFRKDCVWESRTLRDSYCMEKQFCYVRTRSLDSYKHSRERNKRVLFWEVLIVDCVVPVSADNPLAYNLVLVSLYTHVRLCVCTYIVCKCVTKVISNNKHKPNRGDVTCNIEIEKEMNVYSDVKQRVNWQVCDTWQNSIRIIKAQ